MRSFRPVIFAALIPGGSGVPGPTVLAQVPVIAVRPVGEVVGRSTDSIASLASIRPLRDGRVLINDAARRRLLLLDATLAHGRIVADTTAATSHAYGAGLTAMVPFSGDSTLIQDGATSVFIVVDPAGTFSRIIPAPRAATNGLGGTPFGIDATHHLLYRAPAGFFLPPLPPTFLGDTSVLRPDSVAIRRVALGSWHADTIARLQVPRVRDFISRSLNGGGTRSAASPISTGDDAALLPDGVLAVVRARDYHLDWVGPDGRITSGPPIPTEWVHLTNAMKIAVMDSMRLRDSVADGRVTAAAVARGESPPPFSHAYIRPSDLPDNQPPFIVGSTRADADGNVWIMVQGPTPVSGPIFDIIDRQGRRTDRVQLPVGATLAGFAPGIVYFSIPFRPAQPGKVLQLVAARIHDHAPPNPIPRVFAPRGRRPAGLFARGVGLDIGRANG